MEKYQVSKPNIPVMGAVDMARFIACILVVIIHTHPLIENEPLDYYLTSFCRVAVPFFFCTSSMLFWSRKTSITKYILRMLMLYAVWFVIELPYVYYRFFVSDHSFIVQLGMFFDALLFKNTFGASWYLMASMQATLVIWWLSKKFKDSTIYIIAIALYSICCLTALYYGIIQDTSFATCSKYLSYIIVPANSFMVAIIYMMLGKTIATHYKTYSNKWLLYILLSFMCGAVEVYLCKDSYALNDAYFSLIPFSYFLLRILSSLRVNIPESISKYFRASSTLVYFLHAYLLFWATCIFSMQQGFNLFSVILMISIILSIIIFFLLSRRCPIVKKLY